MSYRCFGRAQSLRSDRTLDRYIASELWFELGREPRLELGRCVATLFELLSDDSRFFLKVFRKEKSILKKYLSERVSTFFFFGDLDVNFVVTVLDPNTRFTRILGYRSKRSEHGLVATIIKT